MSETPSDPETGPVIVEPEPAVVVDRGDRKHSRLNQIAAVVGIAAGAVFIVAVIFGTGFWLGLHADKGGGGGHHRGGPPGVVMQHHGPSPMFPGMRPGPGFEFPGGPQGPGGPGERGGPAGPGGPGEPGAERPGSPPPPPTSGATQPPR